MVILMLLLILMFRLRALLRILRLQIPTALRTLLGLFLRLLIWYFRPFPKTPGQDSTFRDMKGFGVGIVWGILVFWVQENGFRIGQSSVRPRGAQ